MAKPPGARPTAQKSKTTVAKAAASTPAVASAAAAAETAPKKPFNPAQFIREVRAEARKVTWTSRKETWITSVMVLIMVVTASLFLFVVDLVLRFGIGAIIKLGS